MMEAWHEPYDWQQDYDDHTTNDVWENADQSDSTWLDTLQTIRALDETTERP
jgi:hypothetical protein